MTAFQIDVPGLTGLLVALAAVLGSGGLTGLLTAVTRRELRNSVGDDPRTVMEAVDGMRDEMSARFGALESRVVSLEHSRGVAEHGGAPADSATPGEESEYLRRVRGGGRITTDRAGIRWAELPEHEQQNGGPARPSQGEP
jgi:hypothetical protein